MHFPTTSYILLGMLSSKEMSGYDLKQQLDKSLYPCYDSPAKSQIYGELRRLTQQGWATATEVPQTHRPDKRVYRITPAGRAAQQQGALEAIGLHVRASRAPCCCVCSSAISCHMRSS